MIVNEDIKNFNRSMSVVSGRGGQKSGNALKSGAREDRSYSEPRRSFTISGKNSRNTLMVRDLQKI